MPHRIEVGLKKGVPDARAASVVDKARHFIGLHFDSCVTRDVYKLDLDLKPRQLRAVQEAFVDPVVAKSEVDRLKPPSFEWLVEISFKPGVTDNVGHTAQAIVEDLLDRPLTHEEGVYTSTQYFVSGRDIDRDDCTNLAYGLLANRLIQEARVYSEAEWRDAPVDSLPPAIHEETILDIQTYDLSGTDEELMRISNEGILSLSLEEMHAIRDHFNSEEARSQRASLGLPAQPTDVEMECIAQTWSEHCKHKIFAGQVNYVDEKGNETTIDSLFKTFIKGSTEKIAERVDWLVSVFTDNAGIIRFNDNLNLAFKAETHNSPSALDPYGGAITGIVGCNRDPMGTGIGCELLYNTWGYCLGSPFYDGDVPEGLFHPRRIRDGVHHGVIDGGNQSGIPWARGFEVFDDRFIGKPLVYCGTVGKLPPTVVGKPSEEKEVLPGYAVVMVGGRIGKDGIHGATFSSAELTHESPAQAVQIGDPITQRMMYEFLVEARDKGLYSAITDNGAGGLSSSVGEMCSQSGGVELDLGLAPLKYAGLQPWEIFVSESQERMTLAVRQEDVKPLLELAETRDVEATVMGTFTDSGRIVLRFGEEAVGCLDLDFLHDGCPRMVLDAKWDPPTVATPTPVEEPSRTGTLLELLGELNVCSKETKSRNYDGEVKGLSAVKPFTGVYSDIPSDATLLFAEPGARDAVVLSEGINPFYSDLDTYHMMTSIVDLAVRRIVGSGGRWGHIAGLDNFCWPDPVQSEKTPDGTYKMAQLVRANQALYDITTAYDVPCISGKDSMKNDSVRGGRKISIPPTVLFSAVGRIEDIDLAVTLSWKEAGDLIYVLGTTRDERGASELYRMWARKAGSPDRVGGQVPTVDTEQAVRIYKAVDAAIRKRLLRSCHTPHLGGLAVGFSICSLGADRGAEIDLGALSDDASLSDDARLFSESNSRFIITCRPEQASELEQAFAGLPLARVGTVSEDRVLSVRGSDPAGDLVRADLDSLRQAFKEPLSHV